MTEREKLTDEARAALQMFANHGDESCAQALRIIDVLEQKLNAAEAAGLNAVIAASDVAKDEVARLTRERDEARQSAANNSRWVRELEAENRAAHKRIQEQAEQIVTLTNRASHEQKLAARESKLVRTAEDRARHLKEAWDSTRDVVLRLEGGLNQRDAELDAVKARVRELQDQSHRTEISRQALVAECAKLRDEVSRLTESRDAGWAIAKARLELNEALSEEIRKHPPNFKLETANEELQRGILQWRQLCDKYRQIHYDATGKVI